MGVGMELLLLRAESGRWSLYVNSDVLFNGMDLRMGLISIFSSLFPRGRQQVHKHALLEGHGRSLESDCIWEWKGGRFGPGVPLFRFLGCEKALPPSLLSMADIRLQLFRLCPGLKSETMKKSVQSLVLSISSLRWHSLGGLRFSCNKKTKRRMKIQLMSS